MADPSNDNEHVAPAQGDDGDFQPSVVLVTGGAGFIGTGVLLHLVPRYPETRFINYDALTYCAAPQNLDAIADADNYSFVHGDICNTELVRHILTTEGVDTIMHFAAQTHVDNSFGNSFEFSRTNMMGTHVLLEAAKEIGIKRFIHVSSDEVYGEVELHDKPLTEDCKLDPTQPYAATKAASEHLAMAYYRSYGLPVIVTRGNNVYGPCQYPEKVMPKFINLTLRGRPCCLHGDGSSRRSFLYVTDVARAFDTLLHKGVPGEVYNIGTRFEITMLEMTRVLLGALGVDESEYDDHIEFVEDRKFNDKRYAIDSSKLKALGWNETVDFDDGIRLTVEWYKEHQDHWGNIENALVAHPRLTNTLAPNDYTSPGSIGKDFAAA